MMSIAVQFSNVLKWRLNPYILISSMFKIEIHSISIVWKYKDWKNWTEPKAHNSLGSYCINQTFIKSQIGSPLNGEKLHSLTRLFWKFGEALGEDMWNVVSHQGGITTNGSLVHHTANSVDDKDSVGDIREPVRRITELLVPSKDSVTWNLLNLQG